jgi:hypothetical protein
MENKLMIYIEDAMAKITMGNIIVIDKSLIPILDSIQMMKFINNKKMYYLETVFDPPNDNDKIVYLTRKNVANLDVISKQILSYPKHTYYVYFVPEYGIRMANLVEYNGIYGLSNVIFKSMPELAVVKIDANLYNMFLPQSMSFNDPFDLHNVSCSLQNMGRYSNTWVLGKDLGPIFRYLKSTTNQNDEVIFKNLLILDRKCDLISPLKVGKSYVAMMKELELSPKSILNDSIYEKIKYEDCVDIPCILSSICKKINDYKKLKNSCSTSELREIIDYMREHPLKKVSYHIEQILPQLISEYNGFLGEFLKRFDNPDELYDYIESIIINTDHKNVYRALCCMAFSDIDTSDLINKLAEKDVRCKRIINNLQNYGYNFETEMKSGMIITEIIKMWIEKVKFNSIYKEEIMQNVTEPVKFINPKESLVVIVGGITYDEIIEIKKNHADLNIMTTNIISWNQFLDMFME